MQLQRREPVTSFFSFLKPWCSKKVCVFITEISDKKASKGKAKKPWFPPPPLFNIHSGTKKRGQQGWVGSGKHKPLDLSRVYIQDYYRYCICGKGIFIFLTQFHNRPHSWCFSAQSEEQSASVHEQNAFSSPLGKYIQLLYIWTYKTQPLDQRQTSPIGFSLGTCYFTNYGWTDHRQQYG